MSRLPPFPVYLFDVDGTLLDSAPDICGAIQSVLETTSIGEIPDEFLRRYIGRHLVDLFGDLFPDYNAEQIDQMVIDYRAVYPQRGHKSTKPFPHVVETVAKLGGRKSTATTKGTPTARMVLEMFGLAPHFDHIQGTDGFPAKPAPDVIFKSLEALGARVEDCLLVGDAGPDMAAGRSAGVKTCAVRYGYGDAEEMARYEPDFWIDDIRELL